MSSSDKISKWKQEAEIDWFSYFIKVWLCFDAWYKSRENTTAKKDFEHIEEIATSDNKIRNILKALLQKPKQELSPEEEDLMKNFANLHLNLIKAGLKNREKKISFEQAKNKINIQPINKIKNNINYSFKLENENIDICISNTSNIKILTYKYKYDLDKLKNKTEFQKLTKYQQDTCLAFYKEFDPDKGINLLGLGDKIDLGSIKLIDDVDAIIYGVIWILYELRCVLFHGDIVPDENTRKVYKYAYLILFQIIDKSGV